MPTTEQYALGQRWLSNTETELGLGTIVALDARTVTILFPATGESRVYASQAAPLTRVVFEAGDTIKTTEGWELQVKSVATQNGQATYSGKRMDIGSSVELKETFISHDFQLDQPQQRLLAGQADEPKWFDIRSQCISNQYRHATSPLLGFVGARVDLIPHQLHIASQVGTRHAPRVLLADEVGLGKTVEAALIIHQQLLTNRAQRVLIVVPSSLVHQWLVEMLRRVNLAFSIFDEERCQAMSEEPGNPFESEQLVLCSLDFLTHNSQYYEQALAASWDLMVVDEAHHLTWSTGQVSQEYAVVEGLAQVTKGVLLLTATPDQLGHESHFARLRLLDPARFHDYPTFIQEEKGYAKLASAIEPLLQGEDLATDQIQAIQDFAGNSMLENINQAQSYQKETLLHKLLDQHGTGRILFRNSRSGVSGFPTRLLKSYPLPQPKAYRDALLEEDANIRLHLTPERQAQFVDTWTQIDPRVDWLITLLQSHRSHKILAICAHASTALQLAEALRVKTGIRASVFHEGMSIVERDKAANYFAQSEEGAQILICSEIGSEGRNFQFAHHLALFDLPLVPDLLEQRIGRLDRIGQKQDVTIHVPYFENSAQKVMLDWYHLGLNAFEHTCPTGTNVYEETVESLFAAIFEPDNPGLLQQLVEQTGELHRQMKQTLEQGRDKLLELNSSGSGRIEPFVEQILQAEESPRLETFMTKLFDCIGVLQEELDDACYLLRPTESMQQHLPGLDEEGMTVTYERRAATQLEHVHFLSWDHPMVQHAMDMVTTDVNGKSAIGISQDKSLPPGTYWLECLYVLSGKAPTLLQLDRFLPPTPVKIAIDSKGYPTDKVFHQLTSVNQKTAAQLAGALSSHIENSLQKAEQFATQEADHLRETSLAEMHRLLGDELSRLTELKEINPSIRADELSHLRTQIESLNEVIQSATLHLESIRLVVNNH